MKAETLLARALERRGGLARKGAAKVARRLANQQLVRSICEDGRPLKRFEAQHGGTEPKRH